MVMTQLIINEVCAGKSIVGGCRDVRINNKEKYNKLNEVKEVMFDYKSFCTNQLPTCSN